MAKVLINDTTLTAIADAIRAKSETSDTMLPGEMAALIAGIKTGEVRYGTFKALDNTKTFNAGANLPEGNFAIAIVPEREIISGNGDTLHVWDIVIDGNSTGKAIIGGSGTSSSYKTPIWTINHASGDITLSVANNSILAYRYNTTYAWIFAGGVTV